MPRRREVEKRNIDPDPKFNDRLVTKLINVVMKDGKKSVAEHIVYGAFQIIEDKNKEEPLKVFKKAMENVKPAVEVKSRRVGGASYQVPIEVPANRRVALGLRWLRDSARNRNERTMEEKLAGEMFDASQSRGLACKKREDTHKMAEANKAFAHYRW
ncbi:MAG: 30S ribosomal protein S7 [Myxococcales bacterium]|nr:30S ribosomal protein S7 [Myxococcales bacterium]USN50887.1 MAG: 30S ribosomal protein S7 [Myxococcales bacterium]